MLRIPKRPFKPNECRASPVYKTKTIGCPIYAFVDDAIEVSIDEVKRNRRDVWDDKSCGQGRWPWCVARMRTRLASCSRKWNGISFSASVREKISYRTHNTFFPTTLACITHLDTPSVDYPGKSPAGMRCGRTKTAGTTYVSIILRIVLRILGSHEHTRTYICLFVSSIAVARSSPPWRPIVGSRGASSTTASRGCECRISGIFPNSSIFNGESAGFREASLEDLRGDRIDVWLPNCLARTVIHSFSLPGRRNASQMTVS